MDYHEMPVGEFGMAIPDITGLTFEELVALRAEVDALIEMRRDEERQKFLKANRAMMQALRLRVATADDIGSNTVVRDGIITKGPTIPEVASIHADMNWTRSPSSPHDPRSGGFAAFEKTAQTIQRPPVHQPATTPGGEPIRFRGPNGEEWTGRGPKVPQWIQELEAQGRSREEFRVAGKYRKR